MLPNILTARGLLNRRATEYDMVETTTTSDITVHLHGDD
jgi:hypothetical protein